jgi:NAD(P)-dependent dehydrogenase (short-subunit alcohol dehydrogenase family)/acyl carrier protein
VDYASHSVQVESVRDHLLEVLSPIVPGSCDVPFFSTVTGGRIDTAELDAGYWYENLRRTVQFAPAARELLGLGYRVFVEISPHPVLTVGLQEILDEGEEPVRDGVVVGSLRRDHGGMDRFLTSLAELHVRGVPVEWDRLFAGRGEALVELPTYAFQRDRYWLMPAAAVPARAVDPVEARFWDAVEREDLEALAGALRLDGGEARSSLGAVLPVLSSWRRQSHESATLDTWRYRVGWKPVAEPAPAVLPGTWLLMVPPGRAAEEAVAALSGLATRVVPVPLTAADTGRVALAARLRDVLADGTTPDGVLSLLALDETAHPDHPALPAGLVLTVALIQALGDLDVPAPLWCATRGAVSVGRSDRVESPPQSLIWGLGRVMGLEQPGRWGGLVDLPRTLDERARARLRGVLAAGEGEDQVAIRDSGVHGCRLMRDPSADRPSAERHWQPSGTVLVTGGTGALGAQVARWLARNGADHVVLVSRRGPEAEDAAGLETELTGLGARVTVAACDVTDREALAELLARIQREHPLTAVFHTAGVNQLASVDELTYVGLTEVVAAKVVGAAHLDALLYDQPLDAFVLFSSIAGVWGSGEHGAYAAANAFLDGLAQQRRARGLAATSVAWGPWAERGMVADHVAGDQLDRRGLPLLSPGPAIDALQHLLDRDETYLAVADVDWERFAVAFTSARPSPLLSEVPEVRELLAAEPEDADGTSPLRRRLTAMTESERKRALLDLVRSEVAAVLGRGDAESIDVSRAFKDIGFDSLTGVELRNRLNAATGLRLPATVVFDYPTSIALAAYLRTELLDAAEEPGHAPDESETRRILTSIPLDRLKEAGLLEALLRIADDRAETPQPARGDVIDTIDLMDVDGLIQKALDSSDFR